MSALARTAAMVLFAIVPSALAAVLIADHGGSAPAEPAGPVTMSVVSPPVDAGTDYRDPTAVCLAFADAVHRRDARTDAGPQDSYRRATAYVTGELASAIAVQSPGRDPTWVTWRGHGVATDPTVSAVPADGDGRPADSEAESYRAARVTFVPVGGDGWRGPAQQRLVLCTLRRDGSGWRVEGYEIMDLAGTP